MKKRRHSTRWWILVVADRGIISYVQVCTSRKAAAQSLASHLREHYRYSSKGHIPAMADWVAQHQPELDVQITEQDSSPLASVEDLSLESLSTFLTSRSDNSFRGEHTGHGFIVLTREKAKSTDRIEACAFAGSLKHNWAGPFAIGSGPDVQAALTSLSRQL